MSSFELIKGQPQTEIFAERLRRSNEAARWRLAPWWVDESFPVLAAAGRLTGELLSPLQIIDFQELKTWGGGRVGQALPTLSERGLPSALNSAGEGDVCFPSKKETSSSLFEKPRGQAAWLGD